MAGPDPYSTGIAAAGALGSYFTGKSAAKAQKEQMRRQAQLLQMQGQTYKAAMPTYQAALAQYAQAAGLDPNHHTMQPMAGQPGYQVGNQWGDPTDQYRFAAAQDSINHLAQQHQNQLQHTLAARGIASSSVGAALAHNQQAALQDLAGFRRNLAIDAPHEAERRRAALLGALGPAFGQGSQASAGYGGQAAQYGQQANQAYAGLGNIVQNWQQQNALQHFSNLYGTNPAGTAGDTPVAYNPNVYAGPAAPTVNPSSYEDWLARQFSQYG